MSISERSRSPPFYLFLPVAIAYSFSLAAYCARSSAFYLCLSISLWCSSLLSLGISSLTFSFSSRSSGFTGFIKGIASTTSSAYLARLLDFEFLPVFSEVLSCLLNAFETELLAADKGLSDSNADGVPILLSGFWF